MKYLIISNVILFSLIGSGLSADCPVITPASLTCNLITGFDYGCIFDIPVEVTDVDSSFTLHLFIHPQSQVHVHSDMLVTTNAYSTCNLLSATATPIQYDYDCDNLVKSASAQFNYTGNGEITGQTLSGTFTITVTNNTMGMNIYVDNNERTSASWTYPSAVFANCPAPSSDIIVACPTLSLMGNTRRCTITKPIDVENDVNSVVHFDMELEPEDVDFHIEHAKVEVLFVGSCANVPYHTIGDIQYLRPGSLVGFQGFAFNVYFHGESSGSLGYNIVLEVTMSSSYDILNGTGDPSILLNMNNNLIIIPLLPPTSYSLDPNFQCSASALSQSDYLSCHMNFDLTNQQSGSFKINIASENQLAFVSLVPNQMYCYMCVSVPNITVDVNKITCASVEAIVYYEDIPSQFALSLNLIMKGSEEYIIPTVDLLINDDTFGLAVTETITLNNVPLVQAATELTILSTEHFCPSFIDSVAWFDVILKLDSGYHNEIYIDAGQSTNTANDLFKFQSIRVIKHTNGVHFVDGVGAHVQKHVFTNNDNNVTVGLGRLVVLSNDIQAEIIIRIYGLVTSGNTVGDTVTLSLSVISDTTTSYTLPSISSKIASGSLTPDSIDISDSIINSTSPKHGQIIRFGESFTVSTILEVSEAKLASISNNYGTSAANFDYVVTSEIETSEPVFAVERIQIVNVGFNLACWVRDSSQQLADTVSETGVALIKSLRLNNVGSGCMQYTRKGDASANQIQLVAQLRLWPNSLFTKLNYTVTSQVFFGATPLHTHSFQFSITPEDPSTYVHSNPQDISSVSMFISDPMYNNALLFIAEIPQTLSLRFWLPAEKSFSLEIYNDAVAREMFRIGSADITNSDYGRCIQCTQYSDMVAVYTTPASLAQDMVISYQQIQVWNDPPTSSAVDHEMEITIPLWFNLICNLTNNNTIRLDVTDPAYNSSILSYEVDVLVYADPDGNNFTLNANINPISYVIGDMVTLAVDWTSDVSNTAPADWIGLTFSLPPFLQAVSFTITSSSHPTANIELIANATTVPKLVITGARWVATEGLAFDLILEIVAAPSMYSGSLDNQSIIAVSLFWEPCPYLNIIEDWPVVANTQFVPTQVSLSLLCRNDELSTESSGLLSNCQFDSSSNYATSLATNARLSSPNFWSPSVYPGSQDYIEIYFGQPTRISALQLIKDGSNALRFPNSLSIQVLHDPALPTVAAWQTIKTFAHPYIWNSDITELSLDQTIAIYSIRIASLDIGVDLVSHQSKPLGFSIKKFIGCGPFANITFSCVPSQPSVSADYVRRSMLALPDGHLFVCNSNPSSFYTCYRTNGSSGEWKAIDPSVHNIIGLLDESIYGLFEDKVSYGISTDMGNTWYPTATIPSLTLIATPIPGLLKSDFDSSPIIQNDWSAKFEGLYYQSELTPRFTWAQFCS